MQKITRQMYDSYRKSLEATLEKSKHNLITRMVPVSCVIAIEIGMKLDPKVISALEKVPEGLVPMTNVSLVNYAEALEEYGKKHWGIAGISPDTVMPELDVEGDVADDEQSPSKKGDSK